VSLCGQRHSTCSRSRSTSAISGKPTSAFGSSLQFSRSALFPRPSAFALPAPVVGLFPSEIRSIIPSSSLSESDAARDDALAAAAVGVLCTHTAGRTPPRGRTEL